MIPVAQRALCPCTATLRGESLEDAAFFPFFDDEGLVHAYMLVWSESPWIVMLDATPGLVVGSRPLELGISLSDLRDLRKDRFHRYARLWHYDPWWLLKEERYHGHPAVPMLKATNAAVPLADWPRAGWFTADLRRVDGDPSAWLGPHPARSKHPRPAWKPRKVWPGQKKP